MPRGATIAGSRHRVTQLDEAPQVGRLGINQQIPEECSDVDATRITPL
jgi:hypothetical protein